MVATISSGPSETPDYYIGLFIYMPPLGIISILEPLGASYYPLASIPVVAQLQSELEFAVVGTNPATFALLFFTI
jgi:hypothetical protein